MTLSKPELQSDISANAFVRTARKDLTRPSQLLNAWKTQNLFFSSLRAVSEHSNRFLIQTVQLSPAANLRWCWAALHILRSSDNIIASKNVLLVDSSANAVLRAWRRHFASFNQPAKAWWSHALFFSAARPLIKQASLFATPAACRSLAAKVRS
jgi:hypothetical protein